MVGSGHTGSKPFLGTFGLLRFFLAALVVWGHTARIWPVAAQSVYIFYVLSGYVTTFILLNGYVSKEQGIARFYANRCLRVFPAYWAVMLAGMLITYFLPGASKWVDTRFYYEYPFETWHTLFSWIRNVFMVATGVSGQLLNPHYVPSSWPVGVELLYWLLLPFMLLHPLLRTLVLAASVSFLVSMVIVGERQANPNAWFMDRYFSTLSAGAFFVLGIYLYYFREKKIYRIPHWFMAVFVVFFVFFVNKMGLLGISFRKAGHFMGILLGTVLVYYASTLNSEALRPHIRKLDDYLGRLSYPLIIVHVPVKVVLVHLGVSTKPGTYSMFVTCLAVSVLCSVLIYLGVERPVESLRRRVRGARARRPEPRQ